MRTASRLVRNALPFAALLAAVQLVSCERDSSPAAVPVASCDDRVRNGAEADVDCGIACPTPCADGLACEWSTDCASGTCTDGRCAPLRPAGRLDRVSPPSGPKGGGTLLRLTGSGFLEGSIVTVGSLVATNVSVKSDSLVLAVAPAHATGLVDVQIVGPDGTTFTSANAFSYFDPATSGAAPTVSGVVPASGSIEGGTWGLVRGTGLAQAQRIFFGASEGTVRHADAERVVFITPAHGAGAVDVRIVAADGQAVILEDGFSYLREVPDAPAIDRVAPARQAAGRDSYVVAVVGRGFAEDAIAFVGRSPATIGAFEATRLELLLPGFAPGSYDVVVTNPSGATAVREGAITFVGPGCEDGIRNREETDVDCGADCGATCLVGQSCGADGDCRSGTCVGGRCARAACVVEGANQCVPEAVCSEGARGWTCTCPEGWSVSNAACVDVDECAGDAAVCDPNATCANVPGSHRCTCRAGYAGDGTTCRAVVYAWRSGSWGLCSTGCGDGSQLRSIECTGDGEPVDDALCPADSRPSATQACRDLSGCTFAWESGSWSACANTCGDGLQTRTVACVRSDGTAVEDGLCEGAKPADSKSCTDLSACTFEWSGSAWSDCSSGCGAGTRSRTVVCRRSDGTVVADDSCAGAAPATSESCSGTSTCTFQWSSTSWTACSNTCGAGTQSRIVTCLRSDGTSVPDAQCTGPKPTASQACAGVSTCTFEWASASWGACSSTCGAGTQTRAVTCRRSDGATVADAECPGAKPAASQGCSDTSQCTYAWNTGTWEACSTSCGGGTQSRAVTCRRSDGVTVADAQCSGAKPPTSQACNTQSCCVATMGQQCVASSVCVAYGYDYTMTMHCTQNGGTVSSSCSAICAAWSGQWVPIGSCPSSCVCRAPNQCTSWSHTYGTTRCDGSCE